MSVVPTNQLFKQQQKRLVPATFKKAFINAVNASTKTVDVYYAQNPQTIIRGIPISNNVDVSTLTVGKKCRVDLFDENNPRDCVMAYTF